MVSRSPDHANGSKQRETEPRKAPLVLTAHHGLAPYPTMSDLPPNGQFLFPLIWNRDPGSSFKKGSFLAITIACSFFMLNPAPLFTWAFPEIDCEWDAKHGITNYEVLMEHTLGLSSECVRNIFWITFVVFGSLAVGDVVLAQGRSKLGTGKPSDTFPWPAAWKTDNYLCYHDMFSEPTRYGRLLRRPGNTLSNFSYMLGFLSILSSCFLGNKPNPYFYSDVEFGCCLMVLCVMSVIWHGSNSPFSQYPDLCTMYMSIAYLLVRYIAHGSVMYACRNNGVDPDVANLWASRIAFLGYSSCLTGAGYFYYTQFTKGMLHGPSPDSVRARITGTSNVFDTGHEDCYVATVCIFTNLPFMFMFIPSAMTVFLYDSAGSRMAATLGYRTIAVGWVYRTWERFLLDGHPVMNYFLAQPAGIYKMVGCALVSPTAQHHMWTGVTLLAGYVHARSLEGMERM